MEQIIVEGAVNFGKKVVDKLITDKEIFDDLQVLKKELKLKIPDFESLIPKVKPESPKWQISL